MGRNISLSHLLFVDNALLFGVGPIRESIYIKENLTLYYEAMGMEVNMHKSFVSFSGLFDKQKIVVIQILPFQVLELSQGIKYLGLTLKVNGYGSRDWDWLSKNLEKRVLGW
jgi:hypothetical protein